MPFVLGEWLFSEKGVSLTLIETAAVVHGPGRNLGGTARNEGNGNGR
jgi:hypothetical protein